MTEFDRGYAAGYRADPLPDGSSKEYYRGWDAGNSDRPTLEELTFDAAKEAYDPLGF